MHERSTEGRTLPQSLESERAILGGLMLDSAQLSTVADLVSPADFYRPAHGRLFALMIEMDARGEPVELVSVIERLGRDGWIEEAGGLTYIASMPDEAPSTENLSYYAGQVAEASKRRSLISSLTDALEQAHNGALDLGELMAHTEGRLLTVTRQVEKGGWASVAGEGADTAQDIVERSAAPRDCAGVSTGYHAIDLLLKGLQPQQLVVLAARPAMGKTALALNIAQAVASQGLPVGFFSMEMSKRQLLQRLLAAEGSIRLGSVIGAALNREEWTQLRLAARRLGIAVGRDQRGQLTFKKQDDRSYPIYIDDTSELSLPRLQQRAKRLKYECPNLALLVVDYIGLMGGGHRGQNRQELVAENTKGLKNLSRDLDIPVLALAQLNRGVEQRVNKRPMLSDLRESGEIEQSADVAAFIYRDDYYNKESLERGVAEVIVAKQRNGPVGTVKLLFEGCYSRFENPSF